VGDDLGPRLDRLLPEEQPHAADGDEVTVAQSPLADAITVHDGAVGGVAVAEEELAAAGLDHRVSARHHRRIAADGDDLIAGEGDLAPVRRRGIDDEPGHRRPNPRGTSA
jgi:hypothetical protein